MPFEFSQLKIEGLVLAVPQIFADGRGYFYEQYKESEFCQGGIEAHFVQTNFSHSTRGVLRGLHYQKEPHTQGKLITVMRGEVFDVAVDIRRGSPSYGQWAGVRLSGQDKALFYVPPGFAHGFCVLSEEVDFFYMNTAEYAPQYDRGVRWDDPAIGIEWPLEGEPILSEKDAGQPLLQDADNDFVYGEI
jgi:dTDP-4-dehydrorhamnose 3,5-epimerase